MTFEHFLNQFDDDFRKEVGEQAEISVLFSKLERIKEILENRPPDHRHDWAPAMKMLDKLYKIVNE